MARILAIDYGMKRCGLAVTDPTQLIASRLETVENIKLMGWLERYFAAEAVETLVLGKPLRLDGSDTHASEPVRQFAEKFSKKWPQIKIEYVDERFTSKMASKALFEAGVPKMKRREKGLVDGVSAVLILQDYLEYRI